MRSLVPTMATQGQSIGISKGMLPQTLIMSRLDQLLRLKGLWTGDLRPFWGDMEAIAVQKTFKYSTTLRNLTLKKDFKRSMYQHFQFTEEYSLTNS
jgi:hypothetical protein